MSMALLGPGVTQVVMAKAIIAKYSIIMLRIRLLVLALFRAHGFKEGIGRRAGRNSISAAALINFSFEVLLLALVGRPF